MEGAVINWGSPGNYIALSVIIGLILFGLFIANLLMVYFKFSSKGKNKNVENKKNENKKGVQSSRKK